MIARINRFLFVLGSLVLSVDSIAGPSIESWTTDAGARVLYVQAPEIPMFDVRVTFAAGSARDGEQKGVANITSALLTQGTDELDANAFSDQLGATGAKLSTGARRDMAYLGLRTMAQEEYSVPALALMEAAMAIAREIAAKSPVATKLAKHALNQIEEMTLRDGYRFEQTMTGQLGQSEDSKEAMRAFVEKREPVFKGR